MVNCGSLYHIIEASWIALVDSIEYKLLKERQKHKKHAKEELIWA